MVVFKMSEENPKCNEEIFCRIIQNFCYNVKRHFKNKDAIKAVNKECGIHFKKQSGIQSGKFNHLEKVFVQWLKKACASNIPVNCQLLKEKQMLKEISLAQIFGKEDVFAS